MRGQPETSWGEMKNAKLNLALTKTGKKKFLEFAAALGIPSSELAERLGRGWQKLAEALGGMDRLENLLAVPSSRQSSTIAQLVEQEIEAQQLGVDEFAEEVDLELAEVEAILAGDRPTTEQVIALSVALHKASGELYGVEELQAIVKQQFNGHSHTHLAC